MDKVFSKVIGTVLLSLIIVMMIGQVHVVFAAKFSKGDIVEVINTGSSGLIVRDAPAGNAIGRKYDGSRGMILDGPQSASLGGVVYTWWKVRWGDDASEGWSAEGYPGGVDYLKYVYISPSTKFSEYNVVTVCNTGGVGLSVRSDPPDLEHLAKVSDGTVGRIIDGPFYGVPKDKAGFYYFWKVHYWTGVVGWSAEDWLRIVVGEPTITSSLTIVESPPYYVGNTITAKFTIKNKADVSFTFDVLTVGGRDPDGQVADFKWISGITLNPGESYNYQGTITLTKAGNYHFFCAYRTPDDVWNPAIPTESGVTNVLDIQVIPPPTPPPFDFNIGISPSSGSVQQGGSISATVTVTLVSGSTQTVSLTTSGLPSGAYATFNPSSGYPTFTSTLTISTSTATPTGTFYVTIIGSGGGLTRTAIYTLTVTSALVNRAPNTPADVSQQRSDGVIISEGCATPESIIIFKAVVSDPDGDSVRLEIELRRMDEPFIGEPTPETISDFVPSGSRVTITRYGLVDGSYKWRYRAKDSKGATSNWVEFGAQGNIDFIVSEDIYWLAKAIMSEAGDCTPEEQAAVGWTVLNRLRSGIYEKSIKRIVTSPRQYAYNKEPTADIVTRAKDLLEGKIPDPTGGATHFFSPKSMPKLYIWWKIKYKAGVTGWSAENYLEGSFVKGGLVKTIADDVTVRYDPFYDNTINMYVIGTLIVKLPKGSEGEIIDGPIEASTPLMTPDGKRIDIGGGLHLVPLDPDDEREPLPTDRWNKVWFPSWAKPEKEITKDDTTYLTPEQYIKGFGKIKLEWRNLPSIRNWNFMFYRPYITQIHAEIESPVELRVYDSQGRVTGLVNGTVIIEIPNSDCFENTVVIFFPNDTYRFELVGKTLGSYGLKVIAVTRQENITFTAADIFTSVNTIHRYVISWDALSRGEEGSTVLVDANGDGLIERIFSSDAELTNDEFIEKTSPTHPTYALTIITNEGGTTYPLPGTYACSANSTVHVTAIPETSYILDRWELNGINVGSDNPYAVFMDENHTIKATFAYAPTLLTISGTVRGKQGNPIPNVLIVAQDASTEVEVASATSNATGAYSMTVPPGTYNLIVTPPSESGCAPTTISNIEIAKDTTIDIVLVPAETVTFNGQVVDRDGNPMSNVYISVYSAAISKSTYTDKSGQFSLNVPPDYYSLQLSYWNWTPTSYESFNLYKHINITEDTYVTIILQNRYLIGKVVDPYGNSAANVSVYVNGWTSFNDLYGSFEAWTTTDIDGNFNFKIFTCSSVSLKAIPPPEVIYGPVYIIINVTDDSSVVVTLTQTVSFGGLIVDRDGSPLPNVYVSVYSAAVSKSAYTNENGQFSMYVPPDYYSLQLTYWNWTADRYESFSLYKYINITEDTFTTFTLENRYLSGMVFDPLGNAVANVSMYVNGWASFEDFYGSFEAWAKTDDEGKFNFKIFISPSITLQAIPPPENPYGPVSTTINVTEDAWVTITLAQTVTFSGQVLDRDGNPVPNVYVSLYSTAVSRSTYTDEYGLFSLNVPPDYYSLQLSYWNWTPTSYESFNLYKHINITQDISVTFTLQNRYLAGKVDVEGRPVANVSIYVNGWTTFNDFYGSFEGWTITNSEGKFTIRILTCPSVSVNAIPPPESVYAPISISNIDVTNDKTVLIALSYKAGVLPTANFNWNPEKPEVGQMITFDASSSLPGSGIIIKHKWSFGDGSYAIGKIVTHSYSASGVYTVTLNVTNSKGLWSIVQKQIEVVELPGPKVPIANFTYSPLNPTVGQEVTFNASDSYDPDGVIVAYSWDFGDGSSEQGKIVTHYYTQEGCYKVTLTVIDNDGKTGSISQTVTVVKPLDVQVETSGLVIKAMSPVDLVVIDPDYLVISKEFSEIPDAVYMEIDLNGDGSLDDYVFIPKPKIGQYIITVIPEQGVDPTATYTLVVATNDATILLAENVPISQIPTEPYIIYPAQFEEPPATQLAIGEPKYVDHSGNIYVSSATPFILTAQDNIGGSGVMATFYRISNETYSTNWLTYTEPFNLMGMADGAYKIEYKSIDKAGNEETLRSANVILHNTPPLASFTWTPSKPKVGEAITFDASASASNGVAIICYQWDFGDGEQATGKIVTHTYATAGTYIIKLNVTNALGFCSIEQKRIQIETPKITISLNIDPDILNLNLKSKGKWVTAYIEFPEGYNVSDIDISSILLNGTIPVDVNAPTAIGDFDNDGVPDLMVKFNRTAVCQLILSRGITVGNVTLSVSGKLANGIGFEGCDTIRVRMPGDINMDGKVDTKDISIICKAFGSFPNHPRWNPIADENEDNKIDIADIALTCRNFGKTYK